MLGQVTALLVDFLSSLPIDFLRPFPLAAAATTFSSAAVCFSNSSKWWCTAATSYAMLSWLLKQWTQSWQVLLLQVEVSAGN